MNRDPHSHKGDNGKVAVVGGSRHQHGAPLFSALAAEASGVDLIYVLLPDWHENVAKETSLNFQVIPLNGESIQEEHIDTILNILATMDIAVIGPGIAHGKENIKTVQDIIGASSCSLVLDATALQPKTLRHVKGKKTVLTPHLGELERMGCPQKDLKHAAQESGAVILLKGPDDTVVSPDGRVQTIAGGNAGLTVGGTGDALAGLIAGLIAQKMEPFEAAILASRTIKKAGELLYAQKGYAYTTRDVISQIPTLLFAKRPLSRDA
ncbi:NAD(P)H-hydrate dehydratase [Candidatus Peregrinibacteria bacterium]|nr:NAD(P)H-hydrate dehydratase [Candidatus Peregrinibacteria bacterium]